MEEPIGHEKEFLYKAMKQFGNHVFKMGMWFMLSLVFLWTSFDFIGILYHAHTETGSVFNDAPSIVSFLIFSAFGVFFFTKAKELHLQMMAGVAVLFLQSYRYERSSGNAQSDKRSND
jgi:hypothetical protein